MTLINGKEVSEQVKQEIAAEVADIVARGGKRPHLAAFFLACITARKFPQSPFSKKTHATT